MSDESKRTFSADWWELFIISLCVILLLFGLFTYVVKQWWLTPNLQRIEVVIVPQDSLRAAYTYDKESLDSLVSNINNIISSNESKYEQLTNAQEDERFKSLASMLLGIISAIALFFGYKSFRDIREKGEEMSRTVATESAKVTAKEEAKIYLESQLPNIVRQELDNKTYQKNVLDTTKASIIAEIKPLVLKELKDFNKDQGQDDEEKVSVGKAMEADEMFGDKTSVAETPKASTPNSGKETSDNQKQESNGEN